MKLCFLHGLDSSPQGTKASLLRAYDSRCLIPNLPPDINERLKVLEHGLREPMLIVGSMPIRLAQVHLIPQGRGITDLDHRAGIRISLGSPDTLKMSSAGRLIREKMLNFHIARGYYDMRGIISQSANLC